MTVLVEVVGHLNHVECSGVGDGSRKRNKVRLVGGHKKEGCRSLRMIGGIGAIAKSRVDRNSEWETDRKA